MNSSETFEEITFDIDAAGGGSSGEAFSARPARRPVEVDAADATDDAASPVFELLSQPVLPELTHATRARLMMQSPTRLYFYWSVGKTSFQALKKTLGGTTDDYRLALRIFDVTLGTEDLHTVEPEGSWWFTARPGTEYRAEIGFYSASRPFVRVLFSNTVATPRKSPSPHSAAEARWAVTTHTFAEVLDASGFEEDAFEVFQEGAANGLASRVAHHLGVEDAVVTGFNGGELHRALRGLLSGLPIDDLKFKISGKLYVFLQEHLANLSAASISEHLGVSEDFELESFTAVGGSLVSIPPRRFRPVSSMDLP